MPHSPLNAEHNWFKQLFELSPDPTWIIHDNRFVECNEAAIRALGYISREEFLNVHPSKLSPPRQPDGEDSYVKAERMMAIAKDRGLHRFEWTHTKASGMNFVAEVTLSAIELGERNVIYCAWRDVTERKRTEEDLRESEARYRALAELSSDWYWQQDENLRFTRMSKPDTGQPDIELNTFEGHTRREAPGVVWDEPELTRLETITAARQPFRDFEIGRSYRDGPKHYVRMSGDPVFDAAGVFKGYRGVGSDITERKRSEQKLLRQNNALSAIVANFPGGISMVDAELRLVEHNDQFKQLLDFPDSLFEKPDPPFEDFIRYNAERGEYGPGDPEQLVAGMVARARNFQPHRIERVRPDGKALEIRGMPLPDGGFVTTYIDISERKQAEEKLHLAASVFTHAREGIVITDAEGNIIEVNEAFNRITGYSREEVLGRNPRLLQSGRQEKEFYTALWRDLSEKGYWHGEIWNRRKTGELYAEMLTISAVCDADGNTQQYVGLFSDITSLKEHERQLDHMAHYDALTTLPNRVLLADRLQQAMSQVQRRGQPLAVTYLDLDEFKAINDRHGHGVGDQLLIAITARMKQALREGDTLARIGGDEFVAVLLDLADIQASEPIIARLLAAADQPAHVGDLVLQVSASLGVTFYPQAEEVDADQLLRQADQAMYQAKLAGKNRYHVFDAEQDRSVRGHHEDLVRIGEALHQGEFVLYYQPKVNMRTGAVTGVEALIRWQHPERGLLSPAVFLPVIEDHPLAVEVGEWVIETVLTQMEGWTGEGLSIAVSVNVSARQLQQGDFVERLRKILAAHPNVRLGELEMEVLETSALEDLARISEVIEACRDMGVRFALDDFGTGYSSLTYLKRLPVTLLKIDQSFVHDMLDDPDDLAILQGVLGLASAFRRDVIAEGVETVEQGALLLRLGCEHAQGYVIARPMPAGDLQDWVAAWRPDPAWLHLASASREDLPLLFASVEHRSWVRAIEEHLNGERKIPPPLDHHQCQFGTWLDAEGQARYGAQPAFTDMELLHRQVHALVAQMCDLHSRKRSADARSRLAELHGLRDALLEQLKLLEKEIR